MHYFRKIKVFSTAVLGSAHEKDVEEAKDHPLLSRFPGSIIRYYETKKSDEYILPTGEDVAGHDEDGELLDSKVIVGDITRITYEAPEDTSTLEIYNNYEPALKKAGFDIIFSGNKEELGWRWTLNLYDRDITPLPGPTSNLATSQKEFRYLSAELTEENEDLDDIWMNITLVEMV